jgi:hypothetical protein
MGKGGFNYLILRVTVFKNNRGDKNIHPTLTKVSLGK